MLVAAPHQAPRKASRRRDRAGGEFGFLNKLLPTLTQGSGVIVGPGQDCALLRFGSQRLLVTVDALVEGIHFRSDWMSPYQLGRRSFLVNASDIAAMGGRPRWCVVSAGVPRGYPTRDLESIHAGIDAAAAECGAAIVGGNLAACPHLTLSVTLIAAAARRVVTRAGASPGDRIFVTGCVGDAALGVRNLKRGRRSGEVIERYREPAPRLAAGRALVESGVVSAMIDVSDGLIQDLGHICEASGVGAVVEAERLPLSGAYRRQSKSFDTALTGGEDYELLCAVPQRRMTLLPKLRRRLRCEMTLIGTVTKRKGLRVLGRDGIAIDLGAKGYDHFAKVGSR
jgi:thiamine-monophosphate kinase